jgi:hypothetical protein
MLWIDMGDHRRAIRVAQDGWRIDDAPPILFRSYSHHRSLVTPASPGSGDLLRLLDFVGFDTDETQLLFLIWVVFAARPDLQRPILTLYGPPGAAKTTAARFAPS